MTRAPPPRALTTWSQIANRQGAGLLTGAADLGLASVFDPARDIHGTAFTACYDRPMPTERVGVRLVAAVAQRRR